MGNKDDDLIIDIEQYLSGALPIEEPIQPWSIDECKHMQVVLDDQAHTVMCRSCDKILDPFWYLQLLSREWKSRRYYDQAAKEAEVKLEQERGNIAAKGKVWEQPKSGVGREAWETFTIAYHPDKLSYMYRRGAEWYGVGGEHSAYHYSVSYARQLIAEGESDAQS